MVSFRFAALMAVVASPLLAAAQNTTPAPSSTVIKNPITTPTTTLPAREMETKGCFATGVPLENHGPYLYRTDGNCQLVCLQEGKNVMGVSDGENCWCGDLVPPKDSQVDDKKCNTPCAGDKTRFACGGPGLLWVALTGKSLNDIAYYEPPESSSSSATPTATAKPATSSAPASNDSESKPNTVAIAVGVVVGLVALAGIGVGIWFFLRRRRQRQAEEDYRRNAANVNAFVNGGKGHTATSSLNDSRLDPSFMDRRTSSGSIADNEDYSRRILKVTNV